MHVMSSFSLDLQFQIFYPYQDHWIPSAKVIHLTHVNIILSLSCAFVFTYSLCPLSWIDDWKVSILLLNIYVGIARPLLYMCVVLSLTYACLCPFHCTGKGICSISFWCVWYVTWRRSFSFPLLILCSLLYMCILWKSFFHTHLLHSISVWTNTN